MNRIIKEIMNLKKHLTELQSKYNKMEKEDCMNVYCDGDCSWCDTSKKLGKIHQQIEDIKEKIKNSYKLKRYEKE